MRMSSLLAFGLLLSAATISAQQYLVTTVAGGGLPASPAPALSVWLPSVSGVAVDRLGNVYFGAGNCVYKVDGTGTLTRVAGSSRPGDFGDGGGVLAERDGGAGRGAVLPVGVAGRFGAAAGIDVEFVRWEGGGERGDRAGGRQRRHQHLRDRPGSRHPGYQRVLCPVGQVTVGRVANLRRVVNPPCSD